MTTPSTRKAQRKVYTQEEFRTGATYIGVNDDSTYCDTFYYITKEVPIKSIPIDKDAFKGYGISFESLTLPEKIIFNFELFGIGTIASHNLFSSHGWLIWSNGYMTLVRLCLRN